MSKKPYITIDGKKIGAGFPPYIVAELSGNHNGDIKRAIALIEAAKMAGASAVKLQTYTADTLTIDHDGDEFLIKGGLWEGRTLYQLYQQAHTPWEWHETLFAEAKKIGITLFSTPFDATAIELLESLDAPAYKIASFELIDLPLIRRVAATKKPLIMSTGNANLHEIEQAVLTARLHGACDIILLHCTSAYPAPISQANLATMAVMRDAFDVEVGLSDHSLGIGVATAATALGAVMIEKHMTLSHADGGPDAAFSVDVQEFGCLVSACNVAASAIGKPMFSSTQAELETRAYRRSLYVVKDINKGERFTEEHVRSIRPGLGIAPKYLDKVLGSTATCDIAFGTPLQFTMFVDWSRCDV